MLKLAKYAGSLALLLGACSGPSPEPAPPEASHPAPAPSAPQVAVPAPAAGSAEALQPAGYAEVVDRLKPYFVQIEAELPANASSVSRLLSSINANNSMRSEAFATGMIVSPDGYIATTHRWLEAAGSVTVKLGDLPALPATMVGRDRLTGIILLKIEAEGLPAMPWPEPGPAPRQGELCLALGSFSGQGLIPTVGVVSSTDWTVLTETGSPGHLLLANAMSTPSHAGGGLFRADGTYWGMLMPTAYFSYELTPPLALALPAKEVRYVVDKLRTEGRVPRGFLGVQIRQLHPDLDTDTGYTGEGGALVVRISPGSPAEQAGLEVNDVIVTVNEERVADAGDLTRIIQHMRPSDQVVLEIVRKGEQLRPEIVLGDMP